MFSRKITPPKWWRISIRTKAKKRRLRAFELRKRGYPYRTIAQTLGVDVSAAFGYIRTELRKLAERTQEHAVELRELELQRLEDAAAAISERVYRGELEAIDRWVRISESRRRLLGLDQATSLEAVVGQAITINLETLEQPDTNDAAIVVERKELPAA